MSESSTVDATPRTAKGRETRQRIIDAATELIFERGVATVTLDDVLRRTRTSKSQLYHYFSDKSDLVRAVIECQRERIVATHRLLLHDARNWDDIQNWRDTIVAFQASRHCRGGCPLGSLANDLAELDPDARSLLSRAFSDWSDVIADGLRGLIANGSLRTNIDPSALALGLLSSLQGGLLLAEIERSTRPLEGALDSSIALLKSMAPEPTEPDSFATT